MAQGRGLRVRWVHVLRAGSHRGVDGPLVNRRSTGAQAVCMLNLRAAERAQSVCGDPVRLVVTLPERLEAEIERGLLPIPGRAVLLWRRARLRAAVANLIHAPLVVLLEVHLVVVPHHPRCCARRPPPRTRLGQHDDDGRRVVTPRRVPLERLRVQEGAVGGEHGQRVLVKHHTGRDIHNVVLAEPHDCRPHKALPKSELLVESSECLLAALVSGSGFRV